MLQFSRGVLPDSRSSSAPSAAYSLPPLVVAGALAALILAYALLAYHPSNWAYLDYVDGYYLYVAHRMAQGAVLYSGVMGVQPPGIYLAGDVLFRLHDSLAAARSFSFLLHAATVLLVYLAGRRLFERPGLGLVAATLYSLAPYSLVWSRTFDPNPLVTCLSLGSFVLLLGRSRAAGFGAGVAGGLALATKIWYLPVALAFVLYLGRRDRRLLPPYLLGLLAPVAFTGLLGSLSADGAFWHGLLVQDASPASADWLEASLVHVLIDDLPLLILAALGLRRTLAASVTPSSPGPWFLVASCCVLGATIKTGTAWPVFQFAEPALALYAARALLPPAQVIPSEDGRSAPPGVQPYAPTHIAIAARQGAAIPPKNSPEGRARSRIQGLFTPIPARQGAAIPSVSRASAPARRGVFALLGLGLVVVWSLPALQNTAAPSDSSVRQVVALLRSGASSDQPVLAPPFYLYLAGRRAVGEYADINLWALQADHGDRPAMALRARTVDDLSARRIPLVLMDNRVRRLGAVPDALRRGYRRLHFDDPLPADRAVEIWAPRR